MPFALPAAFSLALARDEVAIDSWIEVEGLPWAYGLTTRAAGWFSARAASQQRLGVAAVLEGLPRGAEQEARPLDAESSVGQLTVQLQLDEAGTVLPLIGNAARRDGRLALVGDLDASSAVGTITFTGDATAWPSSGAAFIGRETFTYTGKTANTLTGCARGAYALPGLEARQAHTAGDVITAYPRFLATRRIAWFQTLDGTDANRITRWAGTVRGAKLTGGATGIELTMESMESDLQARIFANQRTAKLKVGLASPTGEYEPVDETEPAAETARLVLTVDSTGGAWTDGDDVLLRIGDEYIAGTIAVDGDETAVTVLGRGQFNSTGVQHAPGEELKEVMWTGARDANGTPAEQIGRFTAGDHPFETCLQWLCSRKGDGANGAYDTLPEGWGIGLDASRLNTADILSVRRTWFPAARHLWVYEEPMALKEAMRAVLRPHACYPLTTLGDLLTFRRLSPPIPGETLRSITANGIVAVPTWDANIAEVVGRVIWRCDYDPISGDPRQQFLGELQGPGTEAQEFYAGLWRTLEVEAQGQFTGNDTGVAYFGSRLSTAADEESRRYFEMVRDRYARPFPVLGVECSYDYLDVEAGDLITLTADNLPDVETGAVGLVGAICEVLRRTIDDVRGVVVLTLLHSTASSQARLVAPSGIVSTTAAGLITLSDAEFNDAGQDRTDGFYAGQVVQVFSRDLATSRGTATLTSVTATQLGMATVPAGTVAGDVVTVATYASQPLVEKLRHAFQSDTSELLGADAAHVYAT